jgi:cellulose synthase/poly-beta-1,6-N-acetylglucosamine synthase-like glycosyltransferase
LIVAQQYGRKDIVVLEQVPGEGKQRALRKSYSLATGAIIYLTDIDCRLNDATVNNLIHCLCREDVQVVTGASEPLDTQMHKRFVQTHWGVEQASWAHSISETRGILGRNAALIRQAVDDSGAFVTDAPSGTDYTLAKEVLRAGYHIWFVPGHPMPTVYPESFRQYTRKQARWIRNVFVLGTRYRATTEVWASVRTMALPYVLIGGMVLGVLRFPIAARLSTVLIAHAILNRLWYQHQANFRPGLLSSAEHFLADQVAALRAGLDIARGSRAW